MKIVLALFMLVLLSACSQNISRQHSHRYHMACFDFQDHNEWYEAKIHCEKAIINATYDGSDQRTLAVLHYEYGRAAGVVCDYEQAVRGFEEAYRLDTLNDGPAYLSMLQLARMNFVRNAYKEALVYFKKADKLFISSQVVDEDPITYAEFLKDFSKTYYKLGYLIKSKLFSEKAAYILSNNKGLEPQMDSTPFGKFCEELAGE